MQVMDAQDWSELQRYAGGHRDAFKNGRCKVWHVTKIFEHKFKRLKVKLTEILQC